MISDDELEREAQEFIKRVREMYPLSIKGPLTVKVDGGYVRVKWFFKTFEQDTFDYHLCLN